MELFPNFFFKEVNRTGLWITFIAIILYVRNAFFSSIPLSRYSLYPYRMNGNFVRCSNAYFAAKCQKPYHRMLFLNTLRCMIPEMLKEFIFKGKLVISEIKFVWMCCFIYTTVFHFLPLKYWRPMRWVWTWLMLEYYTKHSADFIDNRNHLD